MALRIPYPALTQQMYFVCDAPYLHTPMNHKESLIVSIHCITFTVIQMDCFQVPESNNMFKLLHHTTEAFLC